MQQETISQIVRRAKQKLFQIPESEWPSIYDTLNGWGWDGRLGYKPSDWEEMEDFKTKKFLWIQTYSPDRKARTRHSVVAPIVESIRNVVGEKALMRYHHTHNLGRTDQQFEDWWQSQKRINH